jgi:spermidine/putrescine transport system permease protein
VRSVSRLGVVGLGVYFWAFVTFLFVPLVVLVVFSVNKSAIPALPLSGFTTHWFHQAFGNGELTTALIRSVSARTPALLPEVIAIGAIIIAGSLLLVVLAEGGRRWAERRLVGANLSRPGGLAGPDSGAAAPMFATGEPS